MQFLKRLADTRLTVGDVIYLNLKIALTVVLCIKLGVLYGLIAFIIINYVVDLTIRLTFGLEGLNTTDKNVFYD